MKIMRMMDISPFCPDAEANYARVACERERGGADVSIKFATDCSRLQLD